MLVSFRNNDPIHITLSSFGVEDNNDDCLSRIVAIDCLELLRCVVECWLECGICVAMTSPTASDVVSEPLFGVTGLWYAILGDFLSVVSVMNVCFCGDVFWGLLE